MRTGFAGSLSVSFFTTFFSLIIFLVFVGDFFLFRFWNYHHFHFRFDYVPSLLEFQNIGMSTVSSESPYLATTEYSPSVLKLIPAFTGKLTENSKLESISPK